MRLVKLLPASSGLFLDCFPNGGVWPADEQSNKISFAILRGVSFIRQGLQSQISTDHFLFGFSMPDTPVTKIARTYYLWVGSFLLLIHAGLWWQLNRQDRRPLAGGSPLQQAGYYRRHAD